MKAGLKMLHCGKGSPLHPLLREHGVKNYFWDGKCDDIVDDFKGHDIIFLKFRDYANKEQFFTLCRELCAKIPTAKCPDIVVLGDGLTKRELSQIRAARIIDYIDLSPAETLEERFAFFIQRYERSRAYLRELRRHQNLTKELKVHNKDLRRLTLMDDLTGLHNTRYMKEIFEGLFEQVRRYKRPLSVFMLDLDHFKDVNDRNDHLIGSTVLKEIGRVLKEYTRKSDIRIRYGGDEFVVIMPETGSADAQFVAERVRKNIEALSMTVTSKYVVKVTASLGVANFNANTHSAYWELLREADMAMYHAKKQGRNRVCTFDGEVIGYDTTKSSFATVLKQILDVDGDAKKSRDEIPELTRYLNFLKKT